MCSPLTLIDQWAYNFGDAFFAQMFLLTGKDYRVPADRRLDAAIKRAVENGKASEEIKGRLHFPIGQAGMYCLELDDIVRGARMNGVGIIERCWDKDEYEFRTSEWFSRKILAKEHAPEGLEEFVREVVTQLNSPEVQEYKTKYVTAY